MVFPVIKELHQFDFSAAPKVNKPLILELARGEFIDQRHNAVFVGPPGTGKTHLSIALGREACRRGYKVKFFTAAALTNVHMEAREEKQVTKLENHIRRCDLIVVDELGYLPLERTAAEHLHELLQPVLRDDEPDRHDQFTVRGLAAGVRRG